MKKLRVPSLIALIGMNLTAFAQDSGPQFTPSGALLRPENYRQWTFVSSGLGMTYGPARPDPGRAPNFTNVFVDPGAYQAFLDTASWPDETIFILEIRRSEENISINSGGRTQGELLLLEASVKDSRRFPGEGWAYFAFDDDSESADPLPQDARCYSCHAQHGAVEWTFTQFYPDLFEIAQRLGTVRDDYDPSRKFGDD